MFDFNNHLFGSQARKLLLQRKSQIKINGVKKNKYMDFKSDKTFSVSLYIRNANLWWSFQFTILSFLKCRVENFQL